MRLYISGTLILFTLALTGVIQAQDSQSRSSVVAEINGATVTLGELQQERADSLFNARRKFYDTEKRALDELIDERLLELQARKENIAPDELVRRHITAEVDKNPITDEQLKILYEATNTDQPFEVVKGQLLDQIHQIREKRIRSEYLKSLRADAKISVTLQEPRIEVAIDGKPVRGSKDAPVKVVEFADYQCPYCRQLEPQLERLRKEYGDKVAIVFKDFPLPNHNHANEMAEAADCAGSQGKFWEYHDFLYNDLKEFDKAKLQEQAKALKLNEGEFDKCVASSAYAAAIQKDTNEGTQLGISGTPTVFVNGRYVTGAAKYETLRDMVEQELAAAGSQPRQTAQR